MNGNRPARHDMARALAGLGLLSIALPCVGSERPVAAAADAAATIATSQPMDAEAPPAWPDAGAVEELLRRETRAALAMQRRRERMNEIRLDASAPNGARTAGVAEPAGERKAASGDADGDGPASRIDLAAIYGVGKRLHVEILHNGRRLRYRHGKKWPDEAPDGAGAYALRAIEGSCVRLDRTGDQRRVCLTRVE